MRDKHVSEIYEEIMWMNVQQRCNYFPSYPLYTNIYKDFTVYSNFMEYGAIELPGISP